MAERAARSQLALEQDTLRGVRPDGSKSLALERWLGARFLHDGCPRPRPGATAQALAWLPASGDGSSAVQARFLGQKAPALYGGGAGRGPAARCVRARGDPHLGPDLGHVRLQIDSAVTASATVLQAGAYEVGPDIVFGPGEYRPVDAAGRPPARKATSGEEEFAEIFAKENATSLDERGVEVGQSKPSVDSLATTPTHITVSMRAIGPRRSTPPTWAKREGIPRPPNTKSTTSLSMAVFDPRRCVTSRRGGINPRNDLEDGLSGMHHDGSAGKGGGSSPAPNDPHIDGHDMNVTERLRDVRSDATHNLIDPRFAVSWEVDLICGR